MSAVVDERVRVYEQPPLRQVAGEAIRPGGLELTERALSLCSLPPGARVLDVGCGTGATVEHLVASHGLSAIGVDPSAGFLQEGRGRNPQLPLLQALGEGLPLVTGSVDAVLAECTLSLMADLGRALAECHRVLRPRGLLAITDLYARQPEGATALHRLPLCSCLVGALPREEFVARLQAQGFEVLVWEDHSAALKRLAAQLILAHGSLESFWCRMVPPWCRCCTELAGHRRAGPAGRFRRPAGLFSADFKVFALRSARYGRRVDENRRVATTGLLLQPGPGPHGPGGAGERES